MSNTANTGQGSEPQVPVAPTYNELYALVQQLTDQV